MHAIVKMELKIVMTHGHKCTCEQPLSHRHVQVVAIYQIKCPFTVLSVRFLFFKMLPDNSRLFPVMNVNLWKREVNSRIVFENMVKMTAEVI